MPPPPTRPVLGVTAAAFVVAGVAVFVGCEDDPIGVPRIASIQLASPVDTILIRGRTVTLTAVASTAAGTPAQTQFDWQSSNPGVATVSGAGVAQALSAGTTTITAESEGVSGQLRLRVVAADVPAITALLGDPLRIHLVEPLQPATRTTIQAALAESDAALTTGNVVALSGALLGVAAQAAAATHADDRALLATLQLLTDHAIRRLGLGSP